MHKRLLDWIRLLRRINRRTGTVPEMEWQPAVQYGSCCNASCVLWEEEKECYKLFDKSSWKGTRNMKRRFTEDPIRRVAGR